MSDSNPGEPTADAPCTNTDHDHEVTGRCPQCGAPSHYDTRVEDYRHDDAPACFLQEPSASACTRS